MSNISQKPEEFRRRPDVASDLLGQQPGRVKSHFIPDAVQKLNPCPRCVQRYQTVKHERFNRKRGFAECRTNSDVGDRIQISGVVERNPRHVDAAFWQQFVFRSQVQRWHRDLTASAGTADDSAFNFKPASE